jgi:hypothetical protein
MLKEELGLSLATIRVLELVRHGKLNLRRAVQTEVNFYGQDGTSPNKTRVRQLIEAETPNAEIEEIEGIVNGRARSGPARKP